MTPPLNACYHWAIAGEACVCKILTLLYDDHYRPMNVTWAHDLCTLGCLMDKTWISYIMTQMASVLAFWWSEEEEHYIYTGFISGFCSRGSKSKFKRGHHHIKYRKANRQGGRGGESTLKQTLYIYMRQNYMYIELEQIGRQGRQKDLHEAGA